VKPALVGVLLLGGLVLAGSGFAQQRIEPPGPLEPRSSGNPLIREGDAHFNRRQDKRVGAVADKGEIAAAVRAYDTAAEAPDSSEARWKLARALVFQALYTNLDLDRKQAVLEKARRVSEDGVGLLERRARRAGGSDFSNSSPDEIAEMVRKESDAPPIFYWAAASWGQWALARGKEAATKVGAADKIRIYAAVVAALDPRFEDGGGYRILGRVHDQAPRMQGETQWASHSEALRYLRLAVATDRASLVNRLYLAESLAAGSPAEKTEAIDLVKSITADAPSPNRLVEDLSTQNTAAADLRAWK